MPDYRVEELAAAAGISVELLRSYQSRGLLPPPRHEGRHVLYGRRHLDRLAEIKRLKDGGYSLKAIASLLGVPRSDAPGAGPAGASSDRAGRGGRPEMFTLRELAERSGVPVPLLRSLEASGVLRPRRVEGESRYTAFDARAVRMLLALLGSGLPMEEFMQVARVQLEASDRVAEGAAQLFLKYVREPLRRSGISDQEEAQRLASGFRLMLDATTMLVTYNFQRMVVNAVAAEIEKLGSADERDALRREVHRQLEAVPTLADPDEASTATA